MGIDWKSVPAEDIQCLCFEHLMKWYQSGSGSPLSLFQALRDRIEKEDSHRIWIQKVDWDRIFKKVKRLEARWERLASEQRIRVLPLYGLPFAVKDNIDVAGMATTAGCPGYSYVPEVSAPVVTMLENAGAVLIGKTNMDQFATGLTGTRSPYGPCKNALNPEYISGGSSAGSAVAVALGLVSFSLGTDTAGSGRVPAALNNIAGLKPTRGMISTTGVVPACRTLDCVSVFANTCKNAQTVLQVIADKNIYGKCRQRSAACKDSQKFAFAIPNKMEFFGNQENNDLFSQAVRQMEAIGGTAVEIDDSPFLQAAQLLYGGPWVAERLAVLGDFISSHPNAVHPVVRQIILEGSGYTAVDLFNAMYRLEGFKNRSNRVWEQADFLMLPTAPTGYTIEEVAADPVNTNKNLGYYTNFVNLLDLAAVAVPSAMRSDGLPFGVSLIAPAFMDLFLAKIGDRYQGQTNLPIGASRTRRSELFGSDDASADDSARADTVLLAVAGAHLTGLELNHQLTEVGATLYCRCKTAREYRMYHLPDTSPPKPGLVRVNKHGAAIDVEVWELPVSSFGAFVANIPSPLGIGTIRLDNGSEVKGFICEPAAIEGATDISRYGGWFNYIAETNKASAYPN